MVNWNSFIITLKLPVVAFKSEVEAKVKVTCSISTCMFQHAATETQILPHSGRYFWERFLNVATTCSSSEPGHNRVSTSHCKNHQKQRVAAMTEVRPSKCCAALPQSLHYFISVTGHQKQPLPFLWTHKRTNMPPKKCRESSTVTKETSETCAKPSLAARAATCWILSLGRMDMVQPLH